MMVIVTMRMTTEARMRSKLENETPKISTISDELKLCSSSSIENESVYSAIKRSENDSVGNYTAAEGKLDDWHI